MAKEICVSPKWEMEVTCDFCKKNTTLKNSSDIFRLLTMEYPYGGITGFMFNNIIIPAYYYKCPYCSNYNHIKKRLIPRKVRKAVQTFTKFYY